MIVNRMKVCCGLLALALTLPGVSNGADIVDTAVKAGSFSTLVAAVKAAGLVDTLKGPGPLTVFAPTDAAFAKLPPGTVETLLRPENKDKLVAILTYHVVPGKVMAADVVKVKGAVSVNGQRIDVATQGGVKVDNANVVTTDIACDNGVIHVIDAVILPAGEPIPAVAGKAGAFKTLLAAVKAAGLAEVLSGPGPFTVFAPTDDAFAKLPAGTVESLLKPENRNKLVDILKYHVVSGRVYSEQAVAAGQAESLQGGKIKIAVSGGAAKVNDATLLQTDLDASNGVIHVIDSVIMPPASGHTQSSPRAMIEQAISQGAPLYNSGHHSECAEVYMSTIEQLVSAHGSQMCPTMMTKLQAVADEARSMSCSDSKAWKLRHSLDMAYQQLSQ